MTIDMMAWALRYAGQGWPVFPLHSIAGGICTCENPECTNNAGKHPRTPNGLKDASRDGNQIRTWWEEWPDANIGFVPGQAGFVVIDVDGPEGEAAAQRLRLLAEPTLSVITSRGVHLYFAHPGVPVGNRILAPKLDVRGDSGYVLLPMSGHRSGHRYRWLGSQRDLKRLPSTVVKMLTTREEPSTVSAAPITWADQPADRLEKRIRGYIAQLPRGLGEGEGRNNAAFQFAAWLTRDLNLSDADAMRWLGTWNVMLRAPLCTRELRQVLSNARRHGRRAFGTALTDPLFADAKAGTGGLFTEAQGSNGALFGEARNG